MNKLNEQSIWLRGKLSLAEKSTNGQFGQWDVLRRQKLFVFMYIVDVFPAGRTSALVTVFTAGRSSAFDFFLCLLFLFFLFILFIFPLIFFIVLLVPSYEVIFVYFCLFFIYYWMSLQLCVTAWLEMSGCHPFASSWSQSLST